VILEELGLCRGRARVDVAVVNGILHGYEIKSDRDGIHRLESQASLYAKVLDRVTLVVGSRLLNQCLQRIPDWWGVLHAQWTSECFHFGEVRAARMNPERDARALVELLWSKHAMALLEERKLARGVRGKPRRIVWDRICEHLPVDEIASAVRTNLKAKAASRSSA
jgi:hypothetical protein